MFDRKEGGNPGTTFYVSYKKEGETNFRKTDIAKDDDFIMVRDLDSEESYDFMVTSVDGDYRTDSDIQTVRLDGPIIRPKHNVATAGWIIGMVLAIAILLLVLIVVCIIKRNRGGKYAVHEREQANGRHDYPDEGGFHEYSQP